ncbi:hypothetical protein IF1G_07203 [Cordyceps javanica]|uniref:Uncharacterized protein n=1 Tax=Cordyceps javanica TaxID=43265 RepID=A0A545UXW8_9HYPO|nr:hypothetical protein IF1G_07203 [Cordyceps javanica]
MAASKYTRRSCLSRGLAEWLATWLPVKFIHPSIHPFHPSIHRRPLLLSVVPCHAMRVHRVIPMPGFSLSCYRTGKKKKTSCHSCPSCPPPPLHMHELPPCRCSRWNVDTLALC